MVEIYSLSCFVTYRTYCTFEFIKLSPRNGLGLTCLVTYPVMFESGFRVGLDSVKGLDWMVKLSN